MRTLFLIICLHFIVIFSYSQVITGTITDFNDGSPIARVLISFRDKSDSLVSILSDTSGKFKLTDKLPITRFEGKKDIVLYFFKWGYENLEKEMTVQPYFTYDLNVVMVKTNSSGNPSATLLTAQSIWSSSAPMSKPEKRLALVIGNSAYNIGQTLKNPVNDANLVSQTLQGLNFEVVTKTNLDKEAMENAIKEFAKKMPYYNVILFYYAGHGVQVDGINYLIPTDAFLELKSDCKFEAVSINFVVEEFEKYPDNTNIVILDACRSNPFRSWARGLTMDEQGFSAINPSSGTIIGFATHEGATASDGNGTNGLYTEELVKQMTIPQPIESVFKKTRVEVEKKSNYTQSPQEWTMLKGDFWFKK